jgi:hypothetical protein
MSIRLCGTIEDTRGIAKSSFCSLLAQLVEQLTVNQFVAGSSPAQGAIYYGEVAERFNALVLKTSVGE